MAKTKRQSGNYVSGLDDGKPGEKVGMWVEDGDFVVHSPGPGWLGGFRSSVPLSEIVGATIQDKTRTSGLRVLALGPGALLWKKHDRFLVLDRDVQGFSSEVIVSAKQGALETLLRDIMAARPEVADDPAMDDDPIATIERLAALRDQGVVTDEEFAAKKAELLSRL